MQKLDRTTSGVTDDTVDDPAPAINMHGCISAGLDQADEVLARLIKQEEYRQRSGIQLIASENFADQAVLDCLGSVLTNKYSEGVPGARYYGGTEFIDKIELLCQRRTLEAFQLDSSNWEVNVQPYSGSPANLAVYMGLLRPHDRLMGLDLFSGGHLTHGFYTAQKRLTASSTFFESLPYKVDPSTGLIDFEGLRSSALVFRPRLLVCGASAYPRFLDFKMFRAIADEVGAFLMCDMSHCAGLIAGGVHPSPFPYCHVVTTTTHKTLRGPRGALIFLNKKLLTLEQRASIHQAVFPGLQGGPHNNQIAAVACQMRNVCSPAWKCYAQQVVANAKALANHLLARGQILATGGTDNHLVLWDVSALGISGSKLEKVAEAVGITINKNTLAGDSSAINVSGVRLGTAAMTTRGCLEYDFVEIAGLLLQCADLCVWIQTFSGSKLKDFVECLSERYESPQMSELRYAVYQFASRFPFPSRSAPSITVAPSIGNSRAR